MSTTQILILFFVLFSLTQISSKRIIRTIAGIVPFGGDGNLATKANVNYPGNAFYSNGDVYIADERNHVIRKVDRFGIISTIAGVPGNNGFGGDGGIATNALLYNPKYVFVNNTNEIYIADNCAIRKINAEGNITTIAGDRICGSTEEEGLAVDSRINQPTCVVVHNEYVYFCDTYNHVIRRISPNGNITTVVGVVKTAGYSGDEGLAINARLNLPWGIAFNANDDMFIADRQNGVIRKVNTAGIITTVAGITYDQVQCQYGGDGGLASLATFCQPSGVYISKNSEMYIVDSYNCVIRKVFANNTIVTAFGKAKDCSYKGDFKDVQFATFNLPNAIIQTLNDEYLIADSANNAIRIIREDRIIEPFAGKNIASDASQTKDNITALLDPFHVYITKNNDVYIADSSNHVIKKLSQSTNTMSIIAGKPGQCGYNGENILATEALLCKPFAVFVHEEYNDIYIAEFSNHVVRKINASGIITTIAGIPGTPGYSGDYLPATQSKLNSITGLYVTKSGDVYIADAYNHLIRKIDHTSKLLISVAGIPQIDGLNTSTIATETPLNFPYGLFVNEQKNELYIADLKNQMLRLVNMSSNTIATISFQKTSITHVFATENDGVYINNLDYSIVKILNRVETKVAGGNSRGFGGDDKDPLQALLQLPRGIFISHTNAMYIADQGNQVIRKVQELCDNYTFNAHATVQANTLTLQMNRSCNTNDDYFGSNYAPLIHIRYNSSHRDFAVFAMDWNQVKQISAEGNILDLLTVYINACFEPESIISNCSFWYEYGVVPSSKTIVSIPSVTTISLIHFVDYSSASVRDFNITVNVFYNNVLNETVVFSSNSVQIVGLSHSTTYTLEMSAQVVYSSGLHLRSIPLFRQVTTQIGVLPSGTVQNLQYEFVDDNVYLYWDFVSTDQQGNIPITRLEIQISNNDNEIDMIRIGYDAKSNMPNYYVYKVLQLAANFEIKTRVCSEIGCGAFGTSVTVHFSRSDSLTAVTTIAVIISITLLLLCFMLVIIITATCCIIVFICIKKRSKQSPVVNESPNFELISKDLIIQEDKLDFQNSVFVGSGASGSVVTAKYFNIDVAIKIIPISIAGIENDLNEFFNELQFLQTNANHENVIRFFGVYESITKNQIGLVMEYCSNGDVSNYVMKKHLQLEQQLSLIKGIANGMEYLHHFNIAHRDLKCENVLLDGSLTPKIIDFGYSRIIKEEANRSLNLTMNIGTAVYCAPEVIKSQLSQENTSMSSTSTTTRVSYDKKCDVYSFAICMYNILFQTKHPYGSNLTNEQILFKLSTNPHFRPSVDDATIEENKKWLIELMKQCWKTNPEERPDFENICSVLKRH